VLCDLRSTSTELDEPPVLGEGDVGAVALQSSAYPRTIVKSVQNVVALRPHPHEITVDLENGERVVEHISIGHRTHDR
jgi:hypothetical protein